MNRRAAAAAAAAERLGWQAIWNGTGANRVVSPSSLTMSLAQAAEGARGASLRSIDGALGFAGEDRGAAFGGLRQSLLQYDSPPAKPDAKNPPASPVVHQASRVVVVDAELKQPFIERVGHLYDAHPEQVGRRKAKANLDAWVKRHTAGLIRRSDVEAFGSPTAVLQDALLFAAQWRQPFVREVPLDFRGVRGKVDGVRGTLRVAYAVTPRWSAVRLPYDDNLAADVILPAEGLAPEALEVADLAEATETLGEKAQPRPVQVAMPTFELGAKTNLLTVLPEVDLTDLGGVFDGATVDLWVQQAKLIVTARGTVGAALTEMSTRGAPPPIEPPSFIVDRPYVFRVLDTRTGWPLFLAVIADPAA